METRICEICEDKPVTKVCLDCKRNRLCCDDCFSHSHQTDIRAKHKSKKYVSGEEELKELPETIYCTQHPELEKSMCCLTCNESYCKECAKLANHRDHKRGNFDQGIEQVCSEYKASFECYQKGIKECIVLKEPLLKFIEKDLAALKKLISDTDAIFQNIEKALKEKRKDIVIVIERTMEERVLDMEFVNAVEVKSKKVIEDCNSFMDKCKTFNCSNFDFISKKLKELKGISEMINKLAITKDITVRTFEPLNFEPVFKQISEIVPSKDLFTYDLAFGMEFYKSNILKKYSDVDLVLGWIREIRKSPPKIKLLWRGSADNFKADEFHKKCNNQGPTISIILSNNGSIFGGYTSLPWGSRGNYQYDETAFIFSVNNKAKFTKQKNMAQSIYDAGNVGPSFGGGHDIGISDSCNTNFNSNSNGNHTYELPPGVNGRTYLVGMANFSVIEIEVYSIAKD